MGMGLGPHLNPRLEVFLAVVNIIVMVTALIGNVLMCISVVRLLRKRLPSNIFILSLVLTDLALCVFQLPVVISSLLNQRFYVLSGTLGTVVCNVSGVIYFSVRQVSFFAVCFIALDRYGALRFPLRYKSIITYRRSVLATVVSWTVCVLVALIPYLYWTLYFYSPIFIYCMWDIIKHPVLIRYVDFLFVPTFVISNAILAFTSASNIVKLHALAKRGRAKRLGSTSSLEKASRTALMVVLAFTVCYVPRYVLVFFKVDPKTQQQITPFWLYYRSISEMLIYLNSGVNPLIYIFRSRQYIQQISLLCGRVQNTLEQHSVGRYQSIPLANLATKTSDMLNLPRHVWDRSSRTASPLDSPRHNKLHNSTDI